MTTRQQILRSSTAGQIPAAGSRAPGELWVTFPDNQLGVIDTSRNAQKLLAVRFFSALASYVVGDVVVQGGELYIAKSSIASGAFNASQWNQIAWISDIPSYAVQAMNDNRIINGDMRIDQRNNGAGQAGVSGGFYVVDRWNYYSNQAGKVSIGRNLNAAGTVAGFPYYLGVQSASNYASTAADSFIFYQIIEADMVSDFAWGTPQAQPVTLSFQVASNYVGTFSGSITNAAATRSYPFAFSIPTANAYQKIVITIPGDTAGGAWVLSGNAGSVTLSFDLGCGANLRGAANTWASAGLYGVTGAASVVSASTAYFYVTGVKLEIGTVATPFNRQSLAKSMADCQRYYQNFAAIIQAVGYAPGAGDNVQTPFMLPVAMRATPTVNLGSPIYGNASALSVNSVSALSLQLQAAVTIPGYGFATANPLTLSAEL